MSMRSLAVVLAGLLLAAVFANAASRSNIQIKVLDSETRALGGDDNNGVPMNCEEVTFDAYCRSSRAPQMTSTLTVQEGNEPPFRISCIIESRFSRCTPLPIGATFEARREKHGIVVYYVDEKGKARSELYKLVASDAKAGSRATATRAAPAAPVADQPVPAPAEDAGQVPAVAAAPAAAASLPATVKCSFSSTPPGAEVTLDGRYVGSTPSVLGVVTGTHVVMMKMPGFAQWKRELTVSPGSDLTVNAVLEKAQ